MEKFILMLKLGIAATISFFAELLGGGDLLLKALLVFIVSDYITGIISAVYNKRLSSAVGFKGILKKALILIIVAVSHWCGVITGTNLIRSAVISFYIANEGISVLENAASCDVLITEKLKSFLEQIKEEETDKQGD